MIRVFCYRCGTMREIKANIVTRSHQDFIAWCFTCGQDTAHHRVLAA